MAVLYQELTSRVELSRGVLRTPAAHWLLRHGAGALTMPRGTRYRVALKGID